MSNYPSGESYEVMYKKYFARSPLELCKLAKVKSGMKVLDLCGGTGRLTLELLGLGCLVTYVDSSTRMLLPDVWNSVPGNISIITLRVEDYLPHPPNETFDAIFCQQAVNYWFLSSEDIPGYLNRIMKKGGKLVFNTFASRPNMAPTVREYKIGARNYVEVAYARGDMVYHVQCCEGHPPHVTEFKYIPHGIFHHALSEAGFKVKMKEPNKTTRIWVCTKK